MAIVAPRRDRIPRMAGVLIPLFSLRTRNDSGCGEIPALAEMIDFALEMGHRAIQLLPLDEAALGEASPYSALSVFAIDPLYIAADSVLDDRCTRATDNREAIGLGRIGDRAELRVRKAKLLERAFLDFREHAGAGQRAAFEAFTEENGEWLSEYALFRALKTRFNWTEWEKWPEPIRLRNRAELLASRRELKDLISMYSYWQFLAHRQWAGVREHAAARGAMLGGDLAFSPARDSAEVWSRQDLFDLTRSVGAPPDAFSASGQRWELPMPKWDRMRADGFALWRLRVRRGRSLYDILRIDHLVGLYRTFSFGAEPDEAGTFFPADEAAQRAQGEEIIRAIKQEAAGAIVVAEDLGVVPRFVRRSLRRLGVPGYKVMRWEKANWGRADERFLSPAEYPEVSLATTGTHDTETLTVWWREAPELERRQLLAALRLGKRVDPRRPLDESALDALLEALYSAPSALAVIPIQDLFGWQQRINLPGSVSADNWSFRLPFALDDRYANPYIRARAAELRALAERTDRFRG